MNNIKYFSSVFVALLLVTGCQDEDQEFGDVVAPTNLVVTFQIEGVDTNNPNGDGSGRVTFMATAENALAYRYVFEGNDEPQLAPNGEITYRFSESGTNTYTVVIIASGTGGVTTSTTIEVTVFSAFDDQEAKELLAGGVGQSKTWYLAASEPGHLGVGPTLQLDLDIDGLPNQYYYPAFYAASPFEKCGAEISDCLCDDEFTFSLDAENQLTYSLDNKGQTFINAAHQQSAVGASVGEDACFDFDTSGTSTVTLVPSSTDWSLVADPVFEARGTVMNFSNEGFMGYYLTAFMYEIIELTEDFLYVRVVDGLDPALAWYHKFSSSPPNQGGGNETFDDLIFEDNFNGESLNNAFWTIEEGTGSNGWGNNELQFYTDRPENIVVSDGLLRITAQRESFEGQNFTSSRIKTEDKFEFTYGRIEVRAKLPEGGGTWPAIWMLGANFSEVSWPEAGEIDIMEHIGNNQNTIYATLHYPENFGANGVTGTTTVDDATQFHIYEAIWTEDTITFYVDGELFHTFNNSESLPFNSDFFLIMNVAIGGNFGGSVDPAFTSSSMEVDYIRVYQ